jgi:methylthioxylose transferase
MDEVWAPIAGGVLIVATVATGLAATAAGVELGAPLAPFVERWEPVVGPLGLVAAGALGGSVALCPRIGRLSRWRFLIAATALGLALRLVLGVARHGVTDLYAVYAIGHDEAANEYLPALPALDFGARFFLDTFAQVGQSLTVNAVGHPPGLLLVLHALDLRTAQGMAALTIGVGALSVPLCYLLARRFLDERRARNAALLYVFAPSALLYGATSADALYATLGLLAAVPLAAVALGGARSAWLGGPAALVVASFFSYANLAIGAWAAVLALRAGRYARALLLAAACGLGLVAGYALLHLGSGYDPIGAVRSAEAVYREGIASTRPYAFWVFGSPVAFLAFLGVPIAWLALRALGRGFGPAVALAAVIAVAALLGFTKAETERIYQFLVPLACVAAAAVLHERRLQPVLAVLAAQALATELLLYTIW